MGHLVEIGQVTLETLVWPGAGEWVPAGLTRLAPLITRAPLAPDPRLSPASLTWSDKRAAFLKEKPRMSMALRIAVAIIGLYAIYSGIGQIREGMGETGDATDLQTPASLGAAQINLQGCRGVATDAVQCAYQNNGAVEAKLCMDVVVICNDGRHVASACSDPVPPGQPSVKLIRNFSPAVAATTTCGNIQYENVKVQ
jgi:hypothetical protein